MENDTAVSEVLDETLIIALGLACAVVAAVLMFGFLIPNEKSAYVVPRFGTQTVAGHPVVTINNLGGDPVYFNATPLAKYRAAFYVDTSAGSFPAVPDPSVTVFSPGDTLYIYYTGTGYNLVQNLTGATIVSLPLGQVVVRHVDTYSGTLIAKKTVVNGPAVTVTAPTASPTSTSTTTPAPTPTATPASTKTITVRWSPTSSGYGSLSPPAKLAYEQEVSVPKGGSQTFYYVPNTGKAVLNIKLDGTTVYTGSSVGKTISYTVTNVQEDRQITATFS